MNKSMRSDGSFFKNGTLIPLSKADKYSLRLFKKFDRNPDQSLDGIELIKFQKYVDRLFQAPKLKNAKPPSIFDAVSMSSNGVTYEQFKNWIIENLTYDDSDLLINENIKVVEEIEVKEVVVIEEPPKPVEMPVLDSPEPPMVEEQVFIFKSMAPKEPDTPKIVTMETVI
jgi:hypothetical protein